MKNKAEAPTMRERALDAILNANATLVHAAEKLRREGEEGAYWANEITKAMPSLREQARHIYNTRRAYDEE